MNKIVTWLFLATCTFLISCDEENNSITPVINTGLKIKLTTTDLIQVVLIDSKDNVGSQKINTDFLPIFDEAISRNGGEFLASFNVYFVGEGSFNPQKYRLYKWANEASAKSFQNDDDAQSQITDLSATLLRELRISYGNPAADVDYQFRTDRIYEVFSGNVVDFNLLGQFAPVQEFAQNSFDRNEFLSLQGNPNIQGNWGFMFGGLVEWPSAEKFNEFVNTDTFLDGVKQFRDPGVSDLVLINGTYELK